MSIERADNLIRKLYGYTAPGEYEKRESLHSLLRQLSNEPEILERLERIDSRDLLSFAEELYKVIPLSSIEELKDILDGNHESFAWKPKVSHFKPIDAIIRNLSEVSSLLSSDPSNILIKLCYVQLITALEAYLGDLLKERVLASNEAIIKLLQNDSELNKEKISLHQAFVNPEYPKSRVQDYLSNLLYHNFEKVIKVYKLSLNLDINYPSADCKKILLKSVNIRHDLVHRNGFNTKGEKINVSLTDVNYLLSAVEFWVRHIETKILV